MEGSHVTDRLPDADVDVSLCSTSDAAAGDDVSPEMVVAKASKKTNAQVSRHDMMSAQRLESYAINLCMLNSQHTDLQLDTCRIDHHRRKGGMALTLARLVDPRRGY